MASKKKKIEIDLNDVYNSDEVMSALKERYWKLIKNENMPHTKTVTNALDKLEASIDKRKEELKLEYSV